MSDTSEFTNALAVVQEMMAPMREATLGYRQHLLDCGMDTDSASRCAADFHHTLSVIAVKAIDVKT